MAAVTIRKRVQLLKKGVCTPCELRLCWEEQGVVPSEALQGKRGSPEAPRPRKWKSLHCAASGGGRSFVDSMCAEPLKQEPLVLTAGHH